VEVKFFAYRGTMQEVCLRLMGKKLLVALAMEGKFASEGLQAIDGDDDILTAMARELVQNKGIGESADSVWRSLGALQPTTSRQIEEEPSLKEKDLAFSPDASPEPIANSALVEMVTEHPHASRRDAGSRQLSLF
jgi:hypothetical protein